MFALLITFFPRAFRERFGADMRDLFRDQVRAARTHGGVLGIGHLWLRTIPSVLHAVALERRDAARDHARNAARTRLALGESASDTTRSDSVLQALMSDLRFAGRMLRKSPVFAIVAVVAISLGSGAVTTIFSAMNAVVLRPLVGTTDGARLFLFDRRTPDFREGMSGSYAFYRHLRDQSHTLDGLAAWSKVDLTIATGGEGIAVYGNIVSGNFFSVLGTRPALGRFFTPDEDRTPLASPVIVVSHSFWETHLGGDSSVIGRPVTVNGHPFTVVGVAPPGFRGIFTPLKTEAWVPLMMQAQVKPNRDLTGASQWLWMFGRLAPGETRETARRELAALTSTWAGEATEPSWARRYTSMRATALTGLPDDARNADASAEFEARKPARCGAIRMAAETRRALEDMRGLGARIAVSSNNGIENVSAFARNAGFKFDLVLGYGGGLAKGRTHLDATSREFGVSRQEMLFVGDSLHDGEIAEREGIPFVGIATTFSPERFALRFPSVPVVRRFSALPTLF